MRTLVQALPLGASSSSLGRAGSAPLDPRFHAGIGVDLCHSGKCSPSEACYSYGALRGTVRAAFAGAHSAAAWPFLVAYGSAWDTPRCICNTRGFITRSPLISAARLELREEPGGA